MQNLGVNYEDVKYRVMDDLKGKNWLATFGMLMLYGMLGGHRFYTGKKGSGIAMLLMTCCIVLIPATAIWMFIDLLMLAMGKFRHADGSELYEQVNWLAWLVIILALLYFLLWIVIGASVANSGHAPIAP